MRGARVRSRPRRSLPRVVIAVHVLRGDVRHELSCVSCGALLRDLKLMPVSAPAVLPVEATAKKRRGPPRGKAEQAEKGGQTQKGKRRKFGVKLGRKLSVSWLALKMWDEIEDVVEDIFD